MPPTTPEDFVVLGHIARAHGVHGAVVVVPYAEEPLAMLHYQGLELLSPDGRTRRPAGAVKGKAAAQGLIIKMAGVTTREAAADLKGWRLGLGREHLPEPEEDEIYLADLIGLAVETKDGRRLGRVANLMEAGGALLLVVESTEEEGREYLLPYHEEFLVSVDEPGGRLVFDPPPGLLDL